jgi:hypothetical protein
VSPAGVPYGSEIGDGCISNEDKCQENVSVFDTSETGEKSFPPRYLRVVTLEDGETVHNAFFDRNFREERS